MDEEFRVVNDDRVLITMNYCVALVELRCDQK